jgi:predicted O-methyltransferase YrrM
MQRQLSLLSTTTQLAKQAPVDLVFLDGRKDLYPPLLKLLKP